MKEAEPVRRRAGNNSEMDLVQQMPGGWGALRRGLKRECTPPPGTPARSTALKSCEVCHRTASSRMRIGKVDFFSLPPTPLCLSSRVWFCNFKNIFFFFAENTKGKRSLERGRAKVRELVRRAGGVGGHAVPTLGQSVCGAPHRVESCCRLGGTASAVRSPDCAAAASRAPSAASAGPHDRPSDSERDRGGW